MRLYKKMSVAIFSIMRRYFYNKLAILCTYVYIQTVYIYIYIADGYEILKEKQHLHLNCVFVPWIYITIFLQPNSC